MSITDHPFLNSDDEYALIKKLLLEIERHPDIDNNWDPGRMDWWRYNYHAEKGIDFFKANARYWKTEADEVVGLFISEYGKDDFFIVIHPDHWSLISNILNWGIHVWGQGKAQISIEVYSFGEQKIAHLLDAGFYEAGHVENVRVYPLAEYEFSYQLKRGFRLMSFAEYGNYESRVEVVRNAFNNPNYSETRYRSLRASPSYSDALDLVIVSPQEESVAYCMGWVQESDATFGYIEPMGVHSDYRQNGFGKALAKECFKRLHSLGVNHAWIASKAEPDISNFLYDALKPATVKRSYKYSLNLGG